jgi:heterotetrameric sarcosine oxidase delta subunit
MLKITCPFCGPRNESEYMHGGPAKPRRADRPAARSDAEWIDYLIVPENPMGPVAEKWWHVRGCGQWVTVTRDTVTHEILGGESDDHVG